MRRFNDCLQQVLTFEGGYVDHHPADRGGAINKGITQAVFDDWNTACNLPAKPVSGISDFEAAEIYLARYWNVCRCDDLPLPLDLLVFDAAFQHGPQRAIKWLQNCVCVAPDGICGDQTLYAVNTMALANQLDALVDNYMKTRAKYYAGIVARDQSQEVFWKGWADRMNTLEIAIA